MLIKLINFAHALWGFEEQGNAKVTPVELIILPEVKREKDGRDTSNTITALLYNSPWASIK